MSRFTQLPIRIQLLAIAILLTLPALGIILYSGLRARHESYRNAEIETQKLADNLAARQEGLVTEAQLLGSLLADLPEVNSRNKEKVEPLIVRIHKKNPQYTSILIADETGRIWASSIDGMDEVSIADRRYFKSARATMRFSSGEYALHRVLNSPTVSFAYPLTRNGNGFHGTVILSYDLAIMRTVLQRSRLPKDTNYVLVDHRGLTLSRGIDTMQPLGTPVSPQAWKALSQGGARGTGVLLRSDGQLRISSWRSLSLAGEPAPYLYLIAGMSLKAAVENENRKLVYSIAMLLPFAGCAFLLAVFVGKRSIAEPVARLRGATQQLAGGDLGARVGPLAGGGEFGALGRVFDEMAGRLQVTLQRLQLATTSGHLGVWDWNIRDETLVWDDRMLELYGIPREEFTGSVYTWLLELHPDDKERAMAACAAALEGERDFDVEFRVVAPDGTVRHIKADGIVIRDGDGSPVRMIGLNRDVTGQKRAVEERLELERRLMHAQKMESLGVLAGGIAHDFNNILTSIVGNTELVLMRLKPDSPLREYLERVSQSALKAAGLARQMLAYSGKGMFVVEPIDLNSVVEEQSRTTLSALPATVDLRLELTRPLPEVKGDVTQIRQLIVNLVVNGCEALGDTAGTVAIRTWSRRWEREELKGAWVGDEPAAGCYVVLEVADTGCGMDEETQARIFDPFFTTKFTGRGLGMSAVQGIVRGHGGVVQIESEPGKGSVFRVLLPAAAQIMTGDGRP
ncbi:PAS domain-containing protein [Geomonas sp. Red32]|uniref:ATP-binding protein n=1 Tax=Geomonas sp. Red32 TaxID=2912856 RepID=UPI00202CB517|nr:ATP-binding protein [Geomonas sp. Red32]MCM0082946.1 PAS domain-containing protein [Geomonas sp. Red32]